MVFRTGLWSTHFLNLLTHHVVPCTDDKFLLSFISGSALLIVPLCRGTDHQWHVKSYISLICVSVFEGSDLQVLDSPVFLCQLILQSLNFRSHLGWLLTGIQGFDHLWTQKTFHSFNGYYTTYYLAYYLTIALLILKHYPTITLLLPSFKVKWYLVCK